MDYNCNICKYSTNDPSNFLRHNKTKKHISNIENISCISECVNIKDKKRSKKDPKRSKKKITLLCNEINCYDFSLCNCIFL
jgi:hypothetical protein